MESSLLLVEILGAIVLGIASHILLFMRGELDNYAIPITLSFILGFFLTVIFISFQLNSILGGIIVGSLLSFLYQVTLGTSILIYRLFFHRLSSFPSSRFYVLSKIVAAYYAARTGRYFAIVQRIHQHYGDIVRIGPCEISINNVDALEPLYAGYSLCERGPWYNLYGPRLILHRTRNRQAHDLERVFWEHGLRNQILDNYIDRIKHQVQVLLKGMPQKEGVLNITAELELYSFNVMATTVFSTSYEGLRRGEAFKLIDKLKCAQGQLGIWGHIPWAWFFSPYFPGVFNGNCGFHDASQNILDYRLKRTPDTPDLISWLQQTEGDPRGPGFPLSEESRLAIVSSFVSNAAALISSLFYLSCDSDTLHELQTEVTPVVRTQEFNMRRSYPVLDSVINEGMRLQPVIPDGGQRKTPPQGIQIGQRWIPGDVVIKVPTYTICQDARYFEYPNSFIPHRWTKRRELVKDKRAFRPFSLGAYDCVAQELALMEVRTAIAYLVSYFDFSLDCRTNPAEFENSGKECFSMVFGPLWIRVRSRGA
ncbi:cytochrome P450 [Xylogone sp. PMI_703]|nr:cytochrome P450 [Xylogone sp. PMI_703]